ncbi:hypothetical protein HGQ62_07780 [Stenotrophomonas maltophilia]|nr:hypothetical protein [Stenotrophomonas maltophilia]NMT71370.1 hypothetical protein [Stenotrophomonas maltophilia]
MALWATLLAHSDQPVEFDRLMKDGFEGHTINAWKPGFYIVHGPKAQELLDALAARAGINIFTRETDILDLENSGS